MSEPKKKVHRARARKDANLGASLKTSALWVVHNSLVHPVMAVADLLHGVTKILVAGTDWLHDHSAPGELTPPEDIPEVSSSIRTDAEAEADSEDEAEGAYRDLGGEG